MNGWIVFAVLLAAYLGIYFLLRSRQGPLPGGFEFTGPLLLWRTQWGKRTIEKVARPKRFWNVIADGGIVLTWAIGLLIFLLLIFTLYTWIAQPVESARNAPGPRELLGLPGVNPMIPLGYGIAALILALVIHEGAHGVMAYVARMRVKSLGLVFFIVPIGAFVEPHDEDLLKSTAREKNRVFAAGPTSNILLAVVAGLLLSFLFVGQMSVANGGDGVVVGTIEEGSAAELAGLRPGDLLTHLDETPTPTREAYSGFLANTSAGDTVTLTFIRDGSTRTTEAILKDRWEYVERVAPSQNVEENRGKGFLGISAVDGALLETLRDGLDRPFASLQNLGIYLSYPLLMFRSGLDVLSPPYNEMFTIGGPLAVLPAPIFFGLAAFLYWVVWLNLMLGTFNALPAGPLDGGQMFRATLAERLMRRYRVDRSQIEVERLEMGGLALKGKDEETQQKLDRVNMQVGRAVRALGFFILGLILLPLFGPLLVRLLIGA